MLSLGIDIGGTFTDVVLADRTTGRRWVAKTPSTPDDPSRAFAVGLAKALELAGARLEDLERIFHGTTVATNAILESKGAVTGLLTTWGFRHVLEIGRHDIPREANIFGWVKPKRPVPPWLIEEIPERLDARGEVIVPLDEAACVEAARRLVACGVESLAICFLHSYANPDHERRAAAAVRAALPDLPVSLSSEVLPAFREFERTMAVVLNAYLLPGVGSYLTRLQARLADAGYRGPLFIMSSNGGVASARTAASRPAQVALSGPAAGVIGAIRIGAEAGFADLISIDVGGTSADVALIAAGRAEVTSENQVGAFPINLPMIDIHTIGAGGGSIARVTAAGALVVGPESAGADPGPACYGRGGTEPTVADANLVLGRIPGHLLAGEMTLDLAAAREAIRRRVAEPLGLSVEDAAAGIVEILDNAMAGAIRVVSIERGRDARRYALIAFGGAGPLHAARLADLLEMPAVVIPPHPGVVAAGGLLETDLRRDFVRTLVQRPPGYDLDAINAALGALEAEASAWLAAEAVPPQDRSLERGADLRYAQQGFELAVECPRGRVDAAALGAIIEAFHQRHEELYTYAARDTAVELVNLRVSALGRLARPASEALAPGRGATGARIGTRRVWFRDPGWMDTPIYERAGLGAGDVVAGPAVVEQLDSTTLVPPGVRAEVLPAGSILLRRR